MNNSLNNFYYDLLNINENNNVISSIEKVISKLKIYMIKNNIQSTQMCKIIANTIYNDLKNVGIASKILNTHDLFDCYEYEFIIVHYKENSSIKFVLIDLTYEQFLTNKNINLSNEINDGSSHYLLNDLLNNGYIKIDEKGFQKYLYSIHQNNKYVDNFKLEDIIYKKI